MFSSACSSLAGFLQIFFLLKESELTPSGANLLDGRYAVFGYAVNGQDNLGLMKVGRWLRDGCVSFEVLHTLCINASRATQIKTGLVAIGCILWHLSTQGM
jgi:cyclophilin family peptidyl-prolyl cis-trans isomerase